MKIVIAPDSFKESLSASEVALTIAEAFHSVVPSWSLHTIPMADGGEGTLEVLVDATKGTLFSTTVTGPIGSPKQAQWGLLGDGKTAIIEMAAAAGLADVPAQLRNPMETTSFGVGELIQKALDHGCEKCWVAFGGSATVDGGLGMLQALGMEIADRSGHSVSRGGKGLRQVERIQAGPSTERRERCTFVGLCDVENPLIGADGAAQVFGPQKGASFTMVQELELGLENWARFGPPHLATQAKTGAAGGLAYALAAHLGAPLKSGFEIISETLNLRKRMEDADLVITGEGQINSQSAHGKVPSGVARMAKDFNVPVIAIAGQMGSGFEQVFATGVQAVFSICPGPGSLQESLDNAKPYLFRTCQEIAKTLKIGSKL